MGGAYLERALKIGQLSCHLTSSNLVLHRFVLSSVYTPPFAIRWTFTRRSFFLNTGFVFFRLVWTGSQKERLGNKGESKFENQGSSNQYSRRFGLGWTDTHYFFLISDTSHVNCLQKWFKSTPEIMGFFTMQGNNALVLDIHRKLSWFGLAQPCDTTTLIVI